MKWWPYTLTAENFRSFFFLKGSLRCKTNVKSLSRSLCFSCCIHSLSKQSSKHQSFILYSEPADPFSVPSFFEGIITECDCWPKTTQSNIHFHTKWKDYDLSYFQWISITETVFFKVISLLHRLCECAAYLKWAKLTSSSNFPSTRSSHDAMLPSESSASGLAGLKVFDM